MDIHIGNLVKDYLYSNGMKQTILVKALNRDAARVSRMIRQADWMLGDVVKASEALGVNLLAYISKNKKTQKISIPHQLEATMASLCAHHPSHYVLSPDGKPGPTPLAVNNLYNRHRQCLCALRFNGRYSLYSWKHTGAVMAVKAGINVKDLQLQLRHHSLAMVDEYLKNLGVMDSEDIRYRYPSI